MKETFSNLPLDVQIKKKDSAEDSILYFDSLNKIVEDKTVLRIN